MISLHELHVWQLSESKIVASVHVLASRDHDFMPIAVKIRKALHHHGIHSSTIQPEYYHPGSIPLDDQMKVRALFCFVVSTRCSTLLQTNGETSCLIMCPADQECDPVENACCRKSVISSKSSTTEIFCSSSNHRRLEYKTMDTLILRTLITTTTTTTPTLSYVTQEHGEVCYKGLR